MSRPLACVLCLLDLAAPLSCGGKASSNDPTGGDPSGLGDRPQAGGSAAGTGSSGAAYGGSAVAGASPTSGGTSGGSFPEPYDPTANECFDDAAAGSVAVRIVNGTAKAVYVGTAARTCAPILMFQVENTLGQKLAPSDYCQRCQTVIGNSGAGCGASCALPSSLALQPGESTILSWNAVYEEQRQVPATCFPPGVRADFSCDVARPAGPGKYTFTAQAGSALDCSQTTTECLPCTPSSAGGCTTESSLITGQMLTASTTVELDGSYGAGNMGGPGGQTREVVLTFSE